MSCQCVTVSRRSSLFGRITKIMTVGRNKNCLERAMTISLSLAADFEQSLNERDTASELSRLCAKDIGQYISVSDNVRRILLLAGDISYRTDGLFDVAAAGSGLSAHWTDIDLSRAGHVRLRKPLRIALGGLKKGFAADLIARSLEECGVGAALVDVGGCIRAFGMSDWRVEFGRMPEDGEAHKPLPVMLRDCALAGIGDYFGITKLVDVRQGMVMSPLEWQADNILVRAPSAAVADALTKVAALKGEDTDKVMPLFGAAMSRFPLVRKGTYLQKFL